MRFNVSAFADACTSYDALGNETQNAFSSFAWNSQGQPVTVAGVAATYNTLGRMVETTSGSTSTHYVYDPAGSCL